MKPCKSEVFFITRTPKFCTATVDQEGLTVAPAVNDWHNVMPYCTRITILKERG